MVKWRKPPRCKKKKTFYWSADERRLWSIIQQGGGVGSCRINLSPGCSPWWWTRECCGLWWAAECDRERWRQMLQRCSLNNNHIIKGLITDQITGRWMTDGGDGDGGDDGGDHRSEIRRFNLRPTRLLWVLFFILLLLLSGRRSLRGSGALGRITPTGRSCSPAPGLSVPGGPGVGVGF